MVRTHAFCQLLVLTRQSYLSQILHGCKSAYCTTPTCLSCNKRLVTRPHRPPTQLTARSLAYYLASQDHPRRGLCPHELRVDPDTLGIQGADGVNIHQGARDAELICDVFPKAPLRPGARGTNAVVDDHGESSMRDAQARLADALAKRHQTKKDPKSLGQSLYDTATMIFSYSKHLPAPISVFTSLQSSRVSLQQSVNGIATSENKRSHDSSHATPTNQPNGHTLHPAVNGNRPSFEGGLGTSNHGSRRPSTSNDEHVPEGVLPNGQRVHRIHHVPERSNEKHVARKPLGLSPLDGTVDRTRTAKSKMKARLGATSLPTQSQKNVPASSASPSSVKNHSTSPKLSNIHVASHLTCDIMDKLKEDIYHHRNEQSANFNFVVDYDTNRKFRPATPFVNRSLFFSLSDTETLLKSFRDEQNKDFANSPLPHLDSYRLANAFQDWNQHNGALIFDSLCISVDALFRPPPELHTQKSPRLKPSRKGAAQRGPSSPDLPQDSFGRYLSDEEAAHIIIICIHALTSLVPKGWPHTWVQVRKFRGWGVIVPGATPQEDFTDGFAHPWLSIVDDLEYEPAVRLASRLLRGIGARLCFEEVLSNLRIQKSDEHGSQPDAKAESSTAPGALADILVRHLEEVEGNAISRKTKTKVIQDTSEDPGWTVTATFMEWLRTIIIKEWDGKALIRKWTGSGAAFALLTHFRG
jgi:hypothetical protein